MTEQKVLHMTPVGRMVQGSPFIANDKDHLNRPLTDKEGNPRVNYFFAIAIAKDNPDFAAFYALMQQAAVAGFPNGEHQKPDFAWKLDDGDAADKISKQGFAGHWILKCSNGFQPKVFNTGATTEIVDPKMLKRGYFIRALVSIKGNGAVGKEGLYVNPAAVEFCGYGEEIVSGPDGSEFVQQANAYMPQGMSAAPLGGANALNQMQTQPGVVQGLPVQAQGLPVQAQGLPVQARGLPVQAQGLPVQAQGLPVQAQGLPVQAQPAQGITPAYDFVNNPTQ